MTVLHREARPPLDPPAGYCFEVSYVPDDGAEHRVPLAQAWAVPFEQPSGSPVHVPEGTAASERAVVVSHNRWPCGV